MRLAKAGTLLTASALALAALVCGSASSARGDTGKGQRAKIDRQHGIRPFPGCYNSVAPFLAAMLQCRTAACLRPFRPAAQRAGEAARLAYFSRMLALLPGDRRAARGLLLNLPTSSWQPLSELGWLGTTLWEGETPAQMIAAGRPFESLSQHAASAVLLFPEFMPRFLLYGLLAIQNPHDPFPDWAARACSSNPGRFRRAFHTLNLEEQRRFAKFIVQPRGCKQVGFPEVN